MTKDFHLSTKTKKISRVLDSDIDCSFMVHRSIVHFIEDTFNGIVNLFDNKLGSRDDCQLVLLCENEERASLWAENILSSCKDVVIFNASNEEDMNVFIEIFSRKTKSSKPKDDSIRIRKFFVFENFIKVRNTYSFSFAKKVDKVINNLSGNKDSYLYFTFKR